jgi:hypothetical protein
MSSSAWRCKARPSCPIGDTPKMSRLVVSGDPRSNPCGWRQTRRRQWRVPTLGQIHRPPSWVWLIYDRYPPCFTVQRCRSRRSSFAGALTRQATCFDVPRGDRSAATRAQRCAILAGYRTALLNGNPFPVKLVKTMEERILNRARCSHVRDTLIPSWTPMVIQTSITLLHHWSQT